MRIARREELNGESLGRRLDNFNMNSRPEIANYFSLSSGKDGNQSSTSSSFGLVSSFKARNTAGSPSTVTNNTGHSSSSSWMNSGQCGSQNISNFLSSNIFGQSSNPPNFMSNNPCGQMNFQNSMNTSLCRQANVQVSTEK